jgi:hypothetical protein
MKRVLLLTLIIVAFAGTSALAKSQVESDYSKRFFTGNIQLGYFSGVELITSATFANFANGFPFAVRLGFGYSWASAGDEWMARRVYIDNNTNGTARSHAKIWDGRFDLMFPVDWLSLERTSVFAGVRRTKFTASFEYIDGDETFDVNTFQWGLGGGVETAFALSPRVDMTFSLGVDYFFRSELSGHDSYYYPNDINNDGIGTYTYKDADAAVSNPDLNTRLMTGIAYRF